MRSPSVDPGILIDRLTSTMSAADRYRDPSPAERSQVLLAVRSMLADQSNVHAHETAFAAIGFVAFHGIDPATDRPFSLFIAATGVGRAWGAILVDRSTPARLVISVPHPVSDINTEDLGIAAHREVPGSILLVAGAHRQASDGAADVAHNDRSLFHIAASEFARHRLPHVQLHGFADKNLPDAQIVVSTGSAPRTELAAELADALYRAGFVTCRAWATRCGRLEGTTNEQGRFAEAVGAVFIHLELSWSVRRDPEQRGAVVVAIHDATNDR